MDEVLHALFPHLKGYGVKDYDDLNSEEQEEYRKVLALQEKAQITLDGLHQHIHTMRQSVEFELTRMLPTDPRIQFMQARLQNYLLFEAFFERPERARQMLDQYKSRTVVK